MIASPCINICKMEAQTGLCTGCFRTIDEITAWSRIGDADRQAILIAITRRRLEHPLSKQDLPSDNDRHR